MIKIFATTLNTFAGNNPYGVHPVCHYALDTLVYYCPEQFEKTSSLAECDAVLTNAPAAPPYSFDWVTADSVIALKKPIFILNDADGAMPDCEGQTPDKVRNFQNFVRGGNGIRAYFYREWFEGYERPDLPFPLLPFELVGYLWTAHPKDRQDYHTNETLENFKSRQWDILFAQSLNCQARIALHNALLRLPRTAVRNLYSTGKLPAAQHLSDQGTARITTAIEGSGIKCCSTHEASLNSVMAMGDIAMHWTYPWIDGENCIRLVYEKNKGEGSLVHNFGRGLPDVDKSILKLQAHLDAPERLYNIMQAGMETARKYSLPEYYKNHLGANIIKYL
jgi:hypothetical protein